MQSISDHLSQSGSGSESQSNLSQKIDRIDCRFKEVKKNEEQIVYELNSTKMLKIGIWDAKDGKTVTLNLGTYQKSSYGNYNSSWHYFPSDN